MMEAYVLVVIFTTINGYGNVTMQEFGDKKACLYAAQQITETWQHPSKPRAFCVPKRLEPPKKGEQ